jgi:hypothetical protein
MSADWREIERVRKNPKMWRSLVLALVTHDDLSEWESDFLADRLRLDWKELTSKQGEKLLQIRDDYEHIKTFRGFSAQYLRDSVYASRLDLGNEDDEMWLKTIHEKYNDGPLPRRVVSRLFGMAKHIGIVEQYA